MTATQDFAHWAAQAPEPRFSSWLRARSGDAWTAATTHRFVDELAAGTLADEHFRVYLVQDYAFIETLVTVVGFAVARAPDMPTKKRWSAFLSVLTSEENDYFERAFEALGVDVAERENARLSETTQSLREAMLDAANFGAYADLLAIIVPAEWVYLTWATARRSARPPQARYAHWITLHASAEFEAFVDWLRHEIDELGPGLSPEDQLRVAARFEKIVDLEVAFFEQAYVAA